MPFLALSAVFLLVSPVIFMGFATIWSNIKQKVSDELYARAIDIVNDLDTPEIEKTFTEFNDKLTAKVDTSISNFKSTFIAEISKIYAEIDGKLTAEAKKNKARDDDFIRKAQKILNNITTKVNNIEEACRNEFSRINVVIEDLQNRINQHYAVVQRSDFDQQSVSNESEANSTNESETDSTNSSSSSSSQKFANIISVIREQFTAIFDRVRVRTIIL
ncbi:hypothetical protein C1646_678228 [Rhizophagus diaphanus]|nr:hypothetical protein C1646_678228 [Rhizophagus diaphanus] [Rhizophagus sp. MUCL 43196]